jgi:hypothetical protein
MADGAPGRDASQSPAGSEERSSLVETEASPAVTSAETGHPDEGGIDVDRRKVAEPEIGQDDSGGAAGGEEP